MNKIYKQAIEQAISENIASYGENYIVEESNGGVSPTDDCCCMIAQYISNEYNNNPDCENFDKKEYINVCINSFYKELKLSDSNYDETNTVLYFLEEEVNRYIQEYEKLTYNKHIM